MISNQKRERDFRKLLKSYDCLISSLEGEGVLIGAAISSHWDDKVTYKGKERATYEHVIDLPLDRVVVMGYTTTNKGIIQRHSDEINYAEMKEKEGLIQIGLEISDCSPQCGPKSVSFYGKEKALPKTMKRMQEYFRAKNSFGGISIHRYDPQQKMKLK